MNKSAVVNAVAQKTGYSKKEVETVLQAILDVVTDTMQEGGQVTFTGFGSFTTSNRAARDGVNPATGEKIKIPAMTVPKFKAGKALKDAVRG